MYALVWPRSDLLSWAGDITQKSVSLWATRVVCIWSSKTRGKTTCTPLKLLEHSLNNTLNPLANKREINRLAILIPCAPFTF